MALIPCPECQKSVSTKATACPHCGYPLDTTAMSVPEPSFKSEPTAPQIEGTTWEAYEGIDTAGSARVLWHFDTGGALWIDNSEAGMTEYQWTQEGQSIHATHEEELSFGGRARTTVTGSIAESGDKMVVHITFSNKSRHRIALRLSPG